MSENDRNVPFSDEWLSQQKVDLKSVVTGVSRGATIQQVYFGKNYTGGFVPVETNNDNMGYLFMTRPDFNLTYSNIRPFRELQGLLANNTRLSTPHAIRCMLDSRSHRLGEEGFDSKLVNRNSPWLSIIENAVISADGWPDAAGGTWASPEGKKHEQTLRNRGLRGFNRVFPLSLTLQNFKGNGVYALLETWTCLNELKQLNFGSHQENVTANRWDNQVAFYRIILDTTKTYVVDYAMTGPAVLKNSSTGAMFGYNLSTPEARVETVNAQFDVAGYSPHDPITIRCFNALVVKYQPKMADLNRHRYMTLIPHAHREYFDFWAYARINPFTFEWQLWIENEIYKEVMSLVGGMITNTESNNAQDVSFADLTPSSTEVELTPNPTGGFTPDDFWSY